MFLCYINLKSFTAFVFKQNVSFILAQKTKRISTSVAKFSFEFFRLVKMFLLSRINCSARPINFITCVFRKELKIIASCRNNIILTRASVLNLSTQSNQHSQLLEMRRFPVNLFIENALVTKRLYSQKANHNYGQDGNHGSFLLYCSAFGVFMIGLTYLMVPLYKVFCQVLYSVHFNFVWYFSWSCVS